MQKDLDDIKDSINTHETIIRTITEQINDGEKKLRDQDNDLDRKQKDFDDKQKELDKALQDRQTELNNLTYQITEENNNLEDAKKEIGKLKDEADQIKDDLVII